MLKCSLQTTGHRPQITKNNGPESAQALSGAIVFLKPCGNPLTDSRPYWHQCGQYETALVTNACAPTNFASLHNAHILSNHTWHVINVIIATITCNQLRNSGHGHDVVSETIAEHDVLDIACVFRNPLKQIIVQAQRITTNPVRQAIDRILTTHRQVTLLSIVHHEHASIRPCMLGHILVTTLLMVQPMLLKRFHKTVIHENAVIRCVLPRNGMRISTISRLFIQFPTTFLHKSA